MTLAQTYSWIFYAIALASKVKPAKFQDIQIVADGINHAVPTQKEMQNSISWLASLNLINREGNLVSLTPEGRLLHEQLSKDVNTTIGVWHNIQSHFSSLGANNVTQIDPNNFAT